MDDEVADQRIEIELTQHEGKRQRRSLRARRGDEVAEAGVGPVPELRDVVAPGSSSPPWSTAGSITGSAGGATDPRSRTAEPAESGMLTVSPDGGARVVGADRDRLVVTALGVGIVALLLGWVLGRAGDGDGTAQTADRPPASDTASDAATTPSLLPGVTLPGAVLPTVPTTVRERRSAPTTLPPEWVITTVALDPRLVGADDRLVALTDQGDLIELDLATGELASLDRGRRAPQNFSSVVAGDGWIALLNDGSGAAQVYRRDTPDPQTVALGTVWETYWQVGTDRFWHMRWDDVGQSQRAVEITIDGEPTGVELTFSGLWPTSADPGGGVIVGDGSFGGFVVTTEGSFRLPGRVLAAGADRWLVLGCADTVESCGPQVVERATGAVRELVLDRPGFRLESMSYLGNANPLPQISPDGSRAIVATIGTDGRTELGIVELDTGAVVSADAEFLGSGAVWSADSRFVYAPTLEGMTAFDVATGDGFEVAPELGRVNALTARLAAG